MSFLGFNVISPVFSNAAMFFGGPMGGNMVLLPANLAYRAFSHGAEGAIQRLFREDGMPKFLQEAVIKTIRDEFKKAGIGGDAPANEVLNDKTKSELQKQTDDLIKQLTDNIRKQLNEDTKDSTAANRAGGTGGKGKKSAMSWLQAIAKALGEVLGEKARKMTELSQKVSDAADAQKAAGDDKKAQQEAAAEMTKVQTELQGVAQEYKLLSETISTVIKSIGEALSTLGRKQ